MEATTSQVEPGVISAEEIALVREASKQCATGRSSDRRLHDLAAQWRALVPLAHGERLVETYVQMYPSLAAEGGIDGWAARESKTVLTQLVLIFPTEDQRFWAVLAALDVAQLNMNMGRERKSRQG